MIERIFAALEKRVSGADLATLSATTGEVIERVAAAVASAISDAVLERWPFWPERIRSTGVAAPAFLRELAELRREALPFLERIHEVSGWPATLHLLVPAAHAVVERFPWEGDHEAIARERARYAQPRPLTEGATAMAILAHLPEGSREAILERHGWAERAALLMEIRARGYCFHPARDAAGWVLSAPLISADGLPYGALCTFGASLSPAEHLIEEAAAAVRGCAVDLAQRAAPRTIVQRASAVVENLAPRA
jgi:hypothetical protein